MQSDVAKRLFLCAEASNTHWTSFLTRVPHMDMSLSIDDQKHGPLAFYLDPSPREKLIGLQSKRKFLQLFIQ